MIKQQYAVGPSIRATLAHRNSDRAVQMLVIIYLCVSTDITQRKRVRSTAIRAAGDRELIQI